jgi:hypothetical protein
MEKKNTIFCDIDGTIFMYRKFETYTETKPEVIPSTLEYLKEQYYLGNMIVLTTARPKNLRTHTLKELIEAEIPFHELVMGIERGVRYLINDMDPNKEGERAVAINLVRDKGFEE